jgi:hypothetical protein
MRMAAIATTWLAIVPGPLLAAIEEEVGLVEVVAVVEDAFTASE